jgi:C-terminal processing protease CtpA/Prc
LDNIKTDDKYVFSKNVNKVLEKYVNNEIKIINKNISKKTKHIQNITYKIKDKVLYISIKMLSIDIYNKLKKIINENENKYQKIVLNLRDNAGGSFTTVREIISTFLPNEYKNIFFIEHKGKSWEMYSVIKDKTLNTITPLEIQVNKKTKRGAMYIAAILSKYKRARIIGEHNKIDNSISRVIPLSNNWDVLLKFQNGFTYDDHRRLLKIYK